jgi:hypothetical protein
MQQYTFIDLAKYTSVNSAISNSNPANISPMGWNPSWNAKSRSQSRNFYLILNPEVRDHVHKSLPLLCILSQMNSVHTLHPFPSISIFDSLSSMNIHLQLNAVWPTTVLPLIYDIAVHSQTVFLSTHM